MFFQDPTGTKPDSHTKETNCARINNQYLNLRKEHLKAKCQVCFEKNENEFLEAGYGKSTQ